MQEGMSLGLISALFAGVIFAFVSVIEGFIGKNVGAVNASLLEHSVSGVIALILIIAVGVRGNINWVVAKSIFPQIVLGAVLVLAGVAAIAYALPRTGVAVGNFAIVFAQIVVAVIIDSIGFSGYERIPITTPRIFGLLLMAAGLYVILPRQP
ncbi:MAG: DMT family transporter [Chloroflexota bacterium]